MTHGSRDLKDRVWVPLSVHFLDDEQINRVSVLAQLVYVRGLLHAKRSASDGVITLRQLLASMFGATYAGIDVQDWNVRDAAEELCSVSTFEGEQALWSDLGDGRYLISGFGKHNAMSVASDTVNRPPLTRPTTSLAVTLKPQNRNARCAPSFPRWERSTSLP